MVAANLSLLKSDVKSWMFARDYQGDWGMREHCVHLAATVHKPGRLKELKLLKKKRERRKRREVFPLKPDLWRIFLLVFQMTETNKENKK